MGIQEAFKLLAEQVEERKRNESARAIAAGFSCFEEYERNELEKSQQREDRYSAYVREQSLITGQSEEHIRSRRYEDHPKQGDTFLETMEPCDCEGWSLLPGLPQGDTNDARTYLAHLLPPITH